MGKKKKAPAKSQTRDAVSVTKSYAVRDTWLDENKNNLVEIKSVNGEISELLVNGEPAGGGGGGMPNCYLATVTFKVTEEESEQYNQSNEEQAKYWAVFLNSEDGMIADSSQFWISNNTALTFMIAEGHSLYLQASSATYQSVTGDAEIYDTYYVKITGDCTITTPGYQF